MVEQLASVMLLTDSFNRENLADKAAVYIKEDPIGLVYFDIQACGEIEKKHGQEACRELLEAWRGLMAEAERAGVFGLFAFRLFADDALLLVRMERGAKKADLCRLAEDMRAHFRRELTSFATLIPSLDFHVGTALLVEGSRTVEQRMYDAVKEAVSEAKRSADFKQQYYLQAEFREILHSYRITAHYQPIVSLADGSIYGYEALARGPKTSYFATPRRLWEFAERERLLYALEKVARQQAIASFSPSERNKKLFINLNANVIHDPQFTPGQTLTFLEQRGLTPENVVFEITERQSIDDYASFTKVLDHYRKQGYRIAIDDAGAGYSSLQAIAELRPDYIKVDRSIIHGVNRDHIKAVLLETLAVFAHKIGCHMIAEGIETVEELQTVHQFGIPFGQGYFLGRPHPNLRPLSNEAARWWESSRKAYR